MSPAGARALYPHERVAAGEEPARVLRSLDPAARAGWRNRIARFGLGEEERLVQLARQVAAHAPAPEASAGMLPASSPHEVRARASARLDAALDGFGALWSPPARAAARAHLDGKLDALLAGLGGREDGDPFAARLLGEAIADAVSRSTLLSRHVLADWPGLSRLARLPRGRAPRIAAFEPGRGDPHSAAGGTAALGFDGGRVVFHKPRSCALDRVWNQRAAALASHMPRGGIGSVETLDQGTHGWQAAATGAAPTLASFRGFGCMSALAWILGARDLHAENIMVGAGEVTVVDAETLFQPRVAWREPQRVARDPALETFWEDSLAATSLLPDIGGLVLRRAPGYHGLSALLGARREARADERDAIIAGFEDGATAIAASLDEFASLAGDALRCPTRILLRDTRWYASAFMASLSPAALASPGHRMLLVDAMLWADPPLGAEAADIHAGELVELLSGLVPACHRPVGARARWMRADGAEGFSARLDEISRARARVVDRESALVAATLAPVAPCRAAGPRAILRERAAVLRDGAARLEALAGLADDSSGGGRERATDPVPPLEALLSRPPVADGAWIGAWRLAVAELARRADDPGAKARVLGHFMEVVEAARLDGFAWRERAIDLGPDGVRGFASLLEEVAQLA